MSNAPSTNYKITKLISQADNANVFDGVHSQFGHAIVVKQLTGEVNELVREVFFSEAEAWAKFKHHRLMRIEEINKERNWVVCEHLSQSFVDRYFGNIDYASLKSTMMEILQGLEYLHTNGVLHFNLTASNVRFNEAENSAKLCDGRCIPINRSGHLPRPRGSNKYRAPEMLDTRFGPIGMATDLYMAATVILEGLAGDRFDTLFGDFVVGTPDPETGWFRWHNSEEQLGPIKTLIPGIPDGLAKLLDDMLSKHVGQRIGSASDAIQELHAVDITYVSQDAPAANDGNTAGSPPSAPPAPRAPTPPDKVAGKSNENKIQPIDRPSTTAFLRVASGPWAGKIVPLQDDSMSIGDTGACKLNFAPNEYPGIAGREFSLSLGAGGWKISETKRPEDCLENVYLRHQVCESSQQVKSGDIIRLSKNGPDIQLVVQGTSAWSWQDVADELNLKSVLAKQNADSSKGKGAPPVKPQSQPAAAQVAKSPSPPKPIPAKQPSGNAPPAPAAAPAPAAPPKPKAPPAPEKKTAAPQKPSQPAKPSAPSPGNAAAPTNAPSAPKPADDKSGKKSSKKNLINWLILLVGLPLAFVVILFLFRPGPDKDKDKGDDQQNVENRDDENKEKDNGEKDNKEGDEKQNGKEKK